MATTPGPSRFLAFFLFCQDKSDGDANELWGSAKEPKFVSAKPVGYRFRGGKDTALDTLLPSSEGLLFDEEEDEPPVVELSRDSSLEEASESLISLVDVDDDDVSLPEEPDVTSVMVGIGSCVFLRMDRVGGGSDQEVFTSEPITAAAVWTTPGWRAVLLPCRDERYCDAKGSPLLLEALDVDESVLESSPLLLLLSEDVPLVEAALTELIRIAAAGGTFPSAPPTTTTISAALTAMLELVELALLRALFLSLAEEISFSSGF